MKGTAAVAPTVASKGGCPVWSHKKMPDPSLCKEGAFTDNRGEGVGDWEEDFGQVCTRFKSKPSPESSSQPLYDDDCY